MKTLTRDEFESLVTTKIPVAEFPDGSDIELTVEQAMRWFDLVSTYRLPSFVIEQHKWVFLGEDPGEYVYIRNHEDSFHQIGGAQ